MHTIAYWTRVHVVIQENPLFDERFAYTFYDIVVSANRKSIWNFQIIIIWWNEQKNSKGWTADAMHSISNMMDHFSTKYPNNCSACTSMWRQTTQKHDSIIKCKQRRNRFKIQDPRLWLMHSKFAHYIPLYGHMNDYDILFWIHDSWVIPLKWNGIVDETIWNA